METIVISGKILQTDPSVQGRVFRVKATFALLGKEFSPPVAETDSKGSFRIEAEIRKEDFRTGDDRLRRRDLKKFPAEGLECMLEVFYENQPLRIETPVKVLKDWTNKIDLVIVEEPAGPDHAPRRIRIYGRVSGAAASPKKYNVIVSYSGRVVAEFTTDQNGYYNSEMTGERLPDRVRCRFDFYYSAELMHSEDKDLVLGDNKLDFLIPVKNRRTIIKGLILEKTTGEIIKETGEIRFTILKNNKITGPFSAEVREGNYSLSFQTLPNEMLKINSVQVDVFQVDGQRIKLPILPEGPKIEEGVENSYDAEVAFPDIILTRQLLRQWDLLSLKFSFRNMMRAGKWLKHAFLNKQAYMIVEFPPQHIAEEAFFQKAADFPIQEKKDEKNRVINQQDLDDDKSTKVETPSFPVHSRLSGNSRLSFKIPSDEVIEFSIHGLLEACAKFELNVNSTALPPENTQFANLSEASVNSLFGQLVKDKNIFKDFPVSAKIKTVLNGSGETSPLANSLLFGRVPNENEILLEQEIGEFIKSIVNKPILSAPKEDETAIEAPFRLIISPHKFSSWKHNTASHEHPFVFISPDPRMPVNPAGLQRSGTIELWHTRLGSKNDSNGHNYIRAIWTRDWDHNANSINVDFKKIKYSYHFPTNTPDNPFRMSLDYFDRQNIVHLSANHYQLGDIVKPVKVENLMLSALGSWMSFRGEWAPPVPLSVEEWLHRATMGRDHYVKVVYKGYLFPFGHRASLIKVTERKMHSEFQPLIGRTVTEFSGGTFKLLDNPRIRKAIDIRNFTNNLAVEFNKIASGFMLDLEGKNASQIDKLIGEYCQKIRAYAANTFKNFETGRRGVNAPRLEKELSDIQSGASRNLAGLAKAATGGNTVRKGYIAYLFQRMYIVVREPVKYYDQLEDTAKRQWPFIALRFNTLVTPDLDPPFDLLGNGQSMFWPTVGNQNLLFHLAGEDYNGNISEFTAPLIFIENNEAKQITTVKVARTDYETDMPFGPDPGFNRRKRPISGQSILMADKGNHPEKVTFETVSLSFTASELLNSPSNDEPCFIPKVSQAEIRIPALKHLLGEVPVAVVKFSERYIKHGFSQSNPGEVFVVLEQEKGFIIDFNKQGDKAGGLVKPNVKIAGISRLIGPFGGDPERIATGEFDPVDFYIGVDSKIFGSIPLPEILAVEKDFHIGNRISRVIKLQPRFDQNGQDLVLFEWDPCLKDWNRVFLARNKDKKATMSICAKLVDYKNSVANNGQPKPGLSIDCTLADFTLDMIGNLESFLIIRVEKISFSSGGGAKSSVDVRIADIEFSGIFSFVEALKDLIPLDGFSNPSKNGTGTSINGQQQKKNGCSLEVSEKGIVSNYSLSLPNLSVGIFSLENLSLGASFSIPFLTDPLSVRFSFCERHRPFCLTVSLLGGGGYFGITLTPSGVHMLEAAFEFGASLSLNFGVASGGVSIMAGIYFKIVLAKNEASLTGYLRINGNVSVLGIINASIELYMSLTYEFYSGKVVGKASLKIEIEIIFFSISVTITVERKFAGSNGDPTFAELMGPYKDPATQKQIEPWVEYCEAFA